MRYEFKRGTDLLEIAARENIPISEIMLRYEMERSEMSREEILAQLEETRQVMGASIDNGLKGEIKGFYTGGDAVKMLKHKEQSLLGIDMSRIVASSMAVVEYNAGMGKIVAAPTAGASGIIPAAVIVTAWEKEYDKELVIKGLLNAGAIGCIIARNASIAGASGGCQAETGSAAAMAASALSEMQGADPATCLHAAAMALKNCMGLVCDPVGGLVECPCVKRNAIGVMNAIVSCDMACAGITSLIPFDEVVDAMKSVGNMMHPDLRETARGGVATTPTGLKMAEILHEQK